MAPAQPAFSDLEANSGRVEPHYPKAGGRRPPAMLRMYVVQVAFSSPTRAPRTPVRHVEECRGNP